MVSSVREWGLGLKEGWLPCPTMRWQFSSAPCKGLQGSSESSHGQTVSISMSWCGSTTILDNQEMFSK